MSCISVGGAQEPFKPAIAQLVEHLTVDVCSYQIVPGSMPGGRFGLVQAFWHKGHAAVMEELALARKQSRSSGRVTVVSTLEMSEMKG